MPVEFRIADSFTDSLARLSAQEQKAVKTTAFDLQLNPANPAMRLHRIDRSRDANFWSIKVTLDIRIIVHRTADSLLLCYAGHHDDAYRWAENRKIERHPKTGAAQLVEVRERVEEEAPREGRVQPQPTGQPAIFAAVAPEDLLRYGVPEDWLDDVRAATEESLLDLVDHLPQEAGEALLELATGGTPDAVATAASEADPFRHPDAERRFRTVEGAKALERALDYPWERWALFLHPSQRQLVEASYDGPARVSGSAGTGKTVVALHRAVHLARRHPEARVLLTTFWRTLADASSVKLDRLVGNEPEIRQRIVARSLNDICRELYTEHFGTPVIASGGQLRELLTEATQLVEDRTFGLSLVMDEWEGVVEAFQLRSWSAYRDAPRLGRAAPIGMTQRTKLWEIFAWVLDALARRGQVTQSQMFGSLTDHFARGAPSPFAFVVADEAQDIGIAALRFLAAIGQTRPDSLFFTGDLGQRIFRQPFPWSALGIDLRGRTHALRISYRTSHQIRRTADRLLPDVLTDADGFSDIRSTTVSSFNGPAPETAICADAEAEIATVSGWLRGLRPRVPPQQIAVFVRSHEQLDRARRALDAAGLPASELTDSVEPKPGAVSIGPMHLAKGLEFKAVAVMACDEDIVPLRSRVETVGDTSDLEDVYTTERHLLYVACTRARDHLLLTGVAPGSAYLAEIEG